MDKFKLLLSIAGILFIISIMANIYQSCQEPKVIRVTEAIDTVKVKNELRGQLEAEFKANLKPIIKFRNIPGKVNIDSLWHEAKQYWLTILGTENSDTLNQIDYYAMADTTITDSMMTLQLQYISPIPLHPSGRFNVHTEWYNQNITHTIETTITEKKSFWQRLFGSFHYSIQSGFGMGLIHKEFDVYIGVGVSYDIGSIF